jgi:hypothetical protein
MIRVFIAILISLALAPLGVAAATCAGPNPAITSASVKGVTNAGTANIYHLTGTVTNLGASGQPSNALQHVDIYYAGNRLDSRSIPPLAVGQSFTFGYDWRRALDAGPGTTTIAFRIDMRQGEDCNPANGTKSVTF